MSFAPLRDERNETAGIIRVCEDITEKEKLEPELHDAEARSCAARDRQRASDVADGRYGDRLEQDGVHRLIYTDIMADGTLTEPNCDAVAELVRATPLPVTAAGGVSSVEDVTALDKRGVAGVIIGKALYTGDVDLRAALRAVEHI